MKFLLPTLLIVMGLVEPCVAASDLELDVRFESKPPAKVSIESDDEMPRYLTQCFDTKTCLYSIKIKCPEADSRLPSDKLRKPYTLVASWPDSSERVYIGISPYEDEKIEIEVYHDQVYGDAKTLDAIDRMGNDYRGQLRRYYAARAFHYIWRYKNREKLYWSALRSARIWFDAATWLALRPKSVFRMDPEIEDIMKSYEALAKKDLSFGKLYRKYARIGYVAEMTAQAEANEFHIVKRVEALTESGQFAEAARLNKRIMAVFEKQSPNKRTTILKYHGVNMKMLTGNHEYLKSIVHRANLPR